MYHAPARQACTCGNEDLWRNADQQRSRQWLASLFDQYLVRNRMMRSQPEPRDPPFLTNAKYYKKDKSLTEGR
jgi:hypothetical protein